MKHFMEAEIVAAEVQDRISLMLKVISQILEMIQQIPLVIPRIPESIAADPENARGISKIPCLGRSAIHSQISLPVDQ